MVREVGAYGHYTKLTYWVSAFYYVTDIVAFGSRDHMCWFWYGGALIKFSSKCGFEISERFGNLAGV